MIKIQISFLDNFKLKIKDLDLTKSTIFITFGFEMISKINELEIKVFKIY